MNSRPSHIQFTRLVDWVEDRLLPTERAQVQEHLAACSQCQAELAHVERMVNTMTNDQATDPPPQVLSRALRIFDAKQTLATPTLAQRLVAALRFDSAQLSPSLGLRAGSAGGRQLIFSIGAFDLDVRITPPTADETGWILAGQVLGSDAIVGHVSLQGTRETHEVPLTDPGEFVLPPVASGEYRLVVYMAAQEIVVDSLLVGA